MGSSKLIACNQQMPIHPLMKYLPLLMRSEDMTRLRSRKAPTVCNISMELLKDGDAMIHGWHAILTAA